MTKRLRPSSVFKKPTEWRLSNGSQFCAYCASKTHNERPPNVITRVICERLGCKYVRFPRCCLSANTRPQENFSSKSGRRSLREVVAYKMFHLILLGNFWYFWKLVAEKTLSLTTGGRNRRYHGNRNMYDITLICMPSFKFNAKAIGICYKLLWMICLMHGTNDAVFQHETFLAKNHPSWYWDPR